GRFSLGEDSIAGFKADRRNGVAHDDCLCTLMTCSAASSRFSEIAFRTFRIADRADGADRKLPAAERAVDRIPGYRRYLLHSGVSRQLCVDLSPHNFSRDVSRHLAVGRVKLFQHRENAAHLRAHLLVLSWHSGQQCFYMRARHPKAEVLGTPSTA